MIIQLKISLNMPIPGYVFKKIYILSINGIEKCIIPHITAIIYSATPTNPDIPINGGNTDIPHQIALAI